ncbi:MAG: family 78 glycoside hydrolase catalytic domain [Propionicimonas sp.]|nr:family 78 glycoside hydrolase catalytic domain [Propionicimonas sp.]
MWKVVGKGRDDSTVSSRTEHCEVALLEPADWEAVWVGWPSSAAAGAQYFRYEFEVPAQAIDARLYVAAVGLVEAWVNGVRVGEDVLEPAITDSSRTVPYRAEDVTRLMHPGRNVLGLVGTSGLAGRLAVLAQLEVRTNHGRQVETTGNDGLGHLWHVAAGPVTEASIYDGETYDSRLESSCWCTAVDEPWGAMRRLGHACAVDPPAGRLVLEELEPIRVVALRLPASVDRLGPTAWVVDFGQNTSGWCRIRVDLPSGLQLCLRYAELTNPDGTVNQENLRSARAIDTYISNGSPAWWEPQWTYHGFRYVQIEGIADAPEIEMRIVRNAVAPTVEFSCNDPRLNALERAVRYTEASNFHGIPTDCPQRDERMGWLNDLTVRAETSVYAFSTNLLLAKFVDDIADTQDAAGAIADTAPFRLGSRPADPVALCYALIPLLLYRHYGNDRPLRKHLDGIRAWCDYLDRRSRNGLVDYSHYGDWAAPEANLDTTDDGFPRSADTPGGFMSASHYVATRRALAELARVAGRDDVAVESDQAAQRATAVINAVFADGNGYCGGSQAANATALYFDLVPHHHRQTTLTALTEDVQSRGRLTTGNLATKYLLEVLAGNSHADLAMQLVQRREYPGWLYMLDHQATTIWERWEERSGTGMNSHNHPMFGTVGAWLYRRLAGLRLDDRAVAFSRILVDPLTTTPVSRASIEVDTVRGKAAVAWVCRDGEVSLDIIVPSGATARVVPVDEVVEYGHHRFTYPAPDPR